MLFTVHGDHPDGDHSKFVRISAVGAVFKAVREPPGNFSTVRQPVLS